MLRKLARVALVVVGDVVDELMTGESREDLVRRIKNAADRGAELALENERLRDQLNAVRFKSPTLWRDEVEMLELCGGLLIIRSRRPDIDPKHKTNTDWAIKVLDNLLHRCEHSHLTCEQFNAQFEGVLSGSVDCAWDPSDDWSADVDSEEWGHFNPPPGYAVCTREWPHDGPCAHPLKGSIR